MLYILTACEDIKARNTIARIAEACGHAIVGAAESPEEIWTEIERGWPTVFITDIGSGQVDGLSLIRQIDEQLLPIVTIAVSGKSCPELIRQAMRGGAVDFLTVPIEEEELVCAFQRAAKRSEEFRRSSGLFQRVDLFFHNINDMSPADMVREQAEIVRTMLSPLTLPKGASFGMLRMFAAKWHDWLIVHGLVQPPTRGADEAVEDYFQRIAELWIARSTAPVDPNGKLVIKMACDYVQQHYMETFTLSEISERFGMSVSYFSAQFKRSTGRSFVEYVNSVRIRKSRELLLLPNVMIYEVAHEVGFATVQYFNKMFKNAVGMTPNEFRKKLGVYCYIPLYTLTFLYDSGFG